MRWIRARLRSRDEGMSLIEVVIAMFIFALVSVGVIKTMISIMSLTRDSRAREIATSLAAEEIDLARDTPDIFALLDLDRDVTLNNDTFHVSRRTQWVSDPSADFSCASATGALRYKRVNVSVTWDNMRGSTEPVVSDTVLNPSEHINDPTLGTILVSVLGVDGTGVAGVGVSISPSAGSTVSATDAQGCTYVLKVTPGTYTVSVSRSGYVSDTQQSSPTATVQVVAGASASVGFQMDEAATYTARLLPTATGMIYSSEMPVTWANTYGRFAVLAAGGTGTATQTFSLHPYAAGYTPYYGDCDLADPAAWTTEVVAGGTLTPPTVSAVAAVPGGSAGSDVGVGIVEVRGGAGRYLRALSTDSCGTSYYFGRVLSTSSSTWTSIALPYGNWTLYTGSSSGSQTSKVTTGVRAAQPTAVPSRTSINSSTGLVTLDPRTLIP